MMGWGEVRVMLLPLGGELLAEPETSAREAGGRAVRVLRTVSVGRDKESGSEASLCQKWLDDRGFRLSEDGPSHVRMARGPIEVFLAVGEGFVREGVFTFKLNKRSYAFLSDWKEVLSRFAEAMGLAPVDAETGERVSPGRSGELLARDPSWREFAEALDWPTEFRDEEEPKDARPCDPVHP